MVKAERKPHGPSARSDAQPDPQRVDLPPLWRPYPRISQGRCAVLLRGVQKARCKGQKGASECVLSDGVVKVPSRRDAITGGDLRAYRKAAKLTQADLASRAGVCRDTVQYWEAKDQVPLRWGAPAALATALGVPKNADFPKVSAPARGWGVIDPWQAKLDAQAEAALSAMKERQAQHLVRLRVKCGAKTRAGGECRNKSEPGKRRCKFHGGKSTGAKTPEGLARIAAAQVRRWAAYRTAKAGKAP